LLDPRNTVPSVHAVVLAGGSAYGLASAGGVVERLAAAGVGFPVGEVPGQVVPIVPGAVLFDLGRGGEFTRYPGADLGAAAYDAASGGAVRQGGVGAGTGAVAGGLKGGVGSASAVLDGGATVAALVVVNSAGSTVDPRTGELYGGRHGLDGEFPAMRRPAADELAAMLADTGPPGPPPTISATTLAVIGTDLGLDKSGCARLAITGHDGIARAIAPAHTPFDGDTVFALATGAGPEPDPATRLAMHHAAADCLTRAVVHAMLAAESVQTAAGRWHSYRDALPSAFDTPQ
jgi:L-aminopeptidase/D-esterase-like protein